MDFKRYIHLGLYIMFFVFAVACEDFPVSDELLMDQSRETYGGIPGSCVSVRENKNAKLSCPNGQVIGSIEFASYGTPKGNCSKGFYIRNCHASNSQNKVESQCLQKKSCIVKANNETFGDPCSGNGKRLSVVYTCSGGGNGNGDGEDNGSSGGYEGSGKKHPVDNNVLDDCEDDEKNLLKDQGFTKIRHVSVGNWTNIFTIQGSPKVTDKYVQQVAKETEYAIKPLIERYPDRFRKFLDRNQGSFPIILIHGTGAGWQGWYGGDFIILHRQGAYDCGLHHELGHLFDIDSASQKFRSHVESVFSSDDMDAIDKFCLSDPDFHKSDGTCLYSEFIAVQYARMFDPKWIGSVENNFPKVYEILLKYAPKPSNYVPFAE